MSENPRGLTIAGLVLTGLLALLLMFSGVLKLTSRTEMKDQFVNRLGYMDHHAVPIGLVELACTALFLIPRTAVIGAVLLTGYFGGATATHVRIGEPFIVPVAVGVLVWLALFLRDPRLRALMPLTRSATVPAPASTPGNR
jgi:hypothetical protein